jgi:hypothetical protein
MSGQRDHGIRHWFRSGPSQQRGSEFLDAPTREREALARVWGIEACDVCGRTILLGEDISRLRSAERVLKVCPTCAAKAVSDGYQRAA